MKRPLWMVVGLLATAAVLLWVGALRGGGAAQSALAALALAAVAAVLATGGLSRRLLGVMVATMGVLTAVLTAVLAAAALASTPLPAALGMAAGALLLAAGVLLVILGHRMPGMGSRYRARARAGEGGSDYSMWDELDAGRDPTAQATPVDGPARPEG